MSLAAEMAKPFAGLLNRARLGFPRYYFQGTGGIGDDLMCTTVFRELKKRGHGRIAAASQRPALFEHNPDVDAIVFHPRPRWNRWLREGLPFVRLGYAEYDPDRDADIPPKEHILIHICRLAGLHGPVDLRPYLHLTTAEQAAGRLAKKQIVIQSSGLSADFAMHNKEWYAERFQAVADEMALNFTVIQLGAASDPKLKGTTDLRGKTSLRESAAILAAAQAFIGQVGGLMHLARSVNCRSVILYGGREHPSQTGYIANENLYSAVECSPCWLRNRCDYDRKCMAMITVEQVLAAARQQIQKHGTLLEVETTIL